MRDLQQYRPPTHTESHVGIDTVVEGEVRPSLSPPNQPPKFNGIYGQEEDDRVVESGISHNLSHPNCAPATGGKTSRLIATLFYKAGGHRLSNGSAPAPPTLATSETAESIPANFAPTTNIDDFPLEPPTSEPEQLDHLYGSYISPLCITSFLHLMSSFPQPPESADMHSSHRCLDTHDHPRVVELTLFPAPSASYLGISDLRKHELIYHFEREWSVDVVLQPDLLWRRYPRLVVFDMDSTLITQEVIDLLASNIKDPPDLAERVANITHRAMLGELEFDAAFQERVALLKGLSADIFTQLRKVLDITKGVPQLLKALRRLGVKTAVLSGGFLPLTSWLANELGIDHAYANEVVIDSATNTLTGEVKGVIVGKERKRELLLEIAEKEGIDLSQVVAVGDGANDLRMLSTAGLGVAWNAKPMVQMEAGARLNSESLVDLLYLFGFTSEEIELLST